MKDTAGQGKHTQDQPDQSMFQEKPTQDQQEHSSNLTTEKLTQDQQDQAGLIPHTKVIFVLTLNCINHFKFYISIHFILKCYNYR